MEILLLIIAFLIYVLLIGIIAGAFLFIVDFLQVDEIDSNDESF